MTGRVKVGDLGGGVMGLRVSKPGFDVSTVPLGGEGISFDSRIDQLTGLWKFGTCVLNQIVPYPSVPQFQPLLWFNRIIGGALASIEFWRDQDAAIIYMAELQSSYFVIKVTGYQNHNVVPAGVYDPNAVFVYALLKGGA